MQKHWRHFIKHMQRLMENVRRGSVVDIALLVSGVALVGALVTVFVVQLLPGSDAPDKNGPKESISSPSSAPAPSSSLAASSSGAASGGAVNPFPADGAASSSAAKPARSGKNPAASSSKKPAASSSKQPAASSSAAPPAPSSSAPPAPPTPPPAAHVHTYGAWVRECAVCETGTDYHGCRQAEHSVSDKDLQHLPCGNHHDYHNLHAGGLVLCAPCALCILCKSVAAADKPPLLRFLKAAPRISCGALFYSAGNN
ncbi:MAG: hypothetical protein RRZ93_06600, partial [Ruthenibacterium sp.]